MKPWIKEVSTYVVDGAALRAARKEYKMSAILLAATANISASFLCDLEHGKRNCSKRTIDKLHAAFLAIKKNRANGVSEQ